MPDKPDKNNGKDSAAARFVESGAVIVLSQCLSCRHLDNGDKFTCVAFAGIIPDAIIANDFDHRETFGGDGDIRFEPTKDAPKLYLKRLYAALDRVEPHKA